jgi:hypothetical protein
MGFFQNPSDQKKLSSENRFSGVRRKKLAKKASSCVTVEKITPFAIIVMPQTVFFRKLAQAQNSFKKTVIDLSRCFER